MVEQSAAGDGAQTREGFDFAFSCRRSGNCCAIPGGVVRVTSAEIRQMARHLGLTEEAFRSRFLQADGATLRNGQGHRCVFLDDGTTAACSIYEARPQQCRDWPFWSRLQTDAGLLEQARRICPGIIDR